MISQHFETYYGLPSEVKFCRKCVISNQRPSSTVEFKNMPDSKKQVIQFDDEGVCSACRYHEQKDKNVNWKQREEALFDLLEPYRRNGKGYDVIVPSSGGKDSSFAAHILKYKYHMNPLTVTWSATMYTDVGWNNMRSLAETGGIDNLLYTPNGKLHKLLTKLAFVNLGHPLQPFIHGQKIIGPAIASKFGIPLIMYGENQAEYGNPIDDNKSPFMRPDFYSIDDPADMVMGGVKVSEIISEYGFTLNDFTAYTPLSKSELDNDDIKVTYLGFFEKWDPQECYYYASENTGFKASPERSPGTYSKYTEIDDKIIPFHFYTTLIKFGIGRATYDACQEIRNGKITRSEGVSLVKKFDQEFPGIFFNDFLDYVDITEEQFYETIDRLRSPHLWKNEDGQWRLRHTVWEEA
jgi:N-acetyl sugar amidotransferase